MGAIVGGGCARRAIVLKMRHLHITTVLSVMMAEVLTIAVSVCVPPCVLSVIQCMERCRSSFHGRRRNILTYNANGESGAPGPHIKNSGLSNMTGTYTTSVVSTVSGIKPDKYSIHFEKSNSNKQHKTNKYRI